MSNILKYFLIGVLVVLFFPILLAVMGFAFKVTFTIIGLVFSFIGYIILGWIIYMIIKKVGGN